MSRGSAARKGIYYTLCSGNMDTPQILSYACGEMHLPIGAPRSFICIFAGLCASQVAPLSALPVLSPFAPHMFAC